MKLLITNALICDLQSVWHEKKCDILIANGLIENIKLSGKKNTPQSSTKTFDANGAIVFPGLMDMRTFLREPGFEHKETLESASLAALAGGFTHITALPDTQPVIQSKASVEFILNRSASLPVHILPYAAITKNREGIEMNELFDLYQAGAVAFTDGNKGIMDSGLMMRSLLYTKLFNGLILSHANDNNLSAGGRMHEGNVSVNLGLKGIPAMAEELMIARDIELARYTKAPLHFSHISSKGSVDLIRKAKKQLLQITCDVAVANLIYTDEAVMDFDSHYKLNPPLRGKDDQKALWEGVADGTINAIVTDHQPEDIENKQVEFEYAAYGITMLQTALSLLLTHAPKNVSMAQIAKALTWGPRQVLKQPQITIAPGQQAEFCCFDPKQNWVLNDKTNFSKSRNSPAYQKQLTGKVTATFTKNKLHKF
ncbi:MAG: dihydroorotase [Bacteroidetes bacterium]|nr:MAG: dihydroorotase [Bacteroidota bacterium]